MFKKVHIQPLKFFTFVPYNRNMSKVYNDKDSNEFTQTQGKIYCLNPAFNRNLPDGANKSLLDVGCGNGFYSLMSSKKGYVYYGIDLSAKMIDKATTHFPDKNFRVGSCFELNKYYKNDYFDVVISSMLFPEFDNIVEFKEALKSMNSVLKVNGTLLLGAAHPTYDMYMRKYLFSNSQVETDFYSYFESGKLYKVQSKLMDIVFEDHHWTLADYLNELVNANFELKFIDECKPIDEAKAIPEYYSEKIVLPSYIVFVAVKRS